MLLQLLKDALPNGKTLPKPHCEVRKGNARLGLRLCVNACKWKWLYTILEGSWKWGTMFNLWRVKVSMSNARIKIKFQTKY